MIGITATRVVERYGAPGAGDFSRWRASPRLGPVDLAAFHLLNALESCAELFTRFGGHSHAVGFSLALGARG